MAILYKLNGIVSGLYLGLQRDTHITTLQSQVQVTFSGFDGDLHAGLTRKSDGRTPMYPRGTLIRNERQVTIVSSVELAQTAAEMRIPEIRPEWIGANILIDGIPHLTLIPPKTRLFFASGAVLLVTGENNPCTVAGKSIEQLIGLPGLANKFPMAAIHRRGLTATVERPGLIRLRDGVTAEVHAQIQYPLDV
jgi:MOSC domain